MSEKIIGGLRETAVGDIARVSDADAVAWAADARDNIRFKRSTPEDWRILRLIADRDLARLEHENFAALRAHNAQLVAALSSAACDVPSTDRLTVRECVDEGECECRLGAAISASPAPAPMPDLADLIARCEQAEGPDPGLHALIARALGWQECAGAWRESGSAEWSMSLPRWTESLDAALPGDDDGYWEISGPRRYLHIPSPVPNYWQATFTLWDPMREYRGWGATEALARRAASLRARAQGA